MVPQTVTVTHSGNYAPCTSTSDSELASGTVDQVVIASNFTCAELLNGGPNNFTIKWNTGQSSVITGNAVASVAGAVLTVTTTGTVTGGLFAGDAVVQQATGPSTAVTLCELGLGNVSSTYQTLVLEITG